MRSVLKNILWCLLSLSVFLFVACGEDGSSRGTLQVALTDAVDPSLKEVVISIKEVRVVPNGSEGDDDAGLPLIKRFEPSLVVNVLDLAYQQEILGEAVVPAGSYNQVRLVLDTNVEGEVPVNYVILQDETLFAIDSEELALTTPSAQTSGVKIVGKFTVLPGEMTAIVLDFDPAKAVHRSNQDKWLLKPTGIRIVEVDSVLSQYGAIIGTVVSNELVVDNAVVSIVPEGGVEPIAAGLVNPVDGSFRALVPEGSYVIQVSAETFEFYSSNPELFDVIVRQDTDAGDIELLEIQTQPELLELPSIQ